MANHKVQWCEHMQLQPNLHEPRFLKESTAKWLAFMDSFTTVNSRGDPERKSLVKTTEIRTEERSQGKKNETWLFICRGDIIKVNKAFYSPPFRDHNRSPINFYDMYVSR